MKMKDQYQIAEPVALLDAEDEKKDDEDYVKFALEAAKVFRLSKDVHVKHVTYWISVKILNPLCQRKLF